MKILFLILFFLSTLQAFAQKAAMVKLIRGEAEVISLGKTTKLKIDDWVESGAMIQTAEKSFVKLIFIDKSQMNVGPNSQMKIEVFNGKDSGVIDLVKGKIRSQVTKDYLQMKDKDKSKLFIKTQNAVMGVRGTDFLISTNGTTTTTILFEGEVVFNNLTERGTSETSQLEDIVNRGVRIFPGEFSVMEQDRPVPTVPALLNIQQRENLEKNKDFDSIRTPSNDGGNNQSKSVVPPGLSGEAVANKADVLKNEVNTKITPEPRQETVTAKDPNGFIKGDLIKPANGSFVHVDSGVIIPPGPGSILDKNTNTFIPGPETGKVAVDGNFVPPKNVEITSDGKIMVAIPDAAGVVKVQEVPKPAPVIAAGMIPQPGPGPGIGGVRNDIINPNFVPGGLNDLGNLNLNRTGGVSGALDPARGATKVDANINVQGP